MQMEYPLKDKIWTPKDTAFDSLKYNYFKKKKKKHKIGFIILSTPFSPNTS